MARTAGAVEDEDGRNAREIRRLRRKRARALAWFFGWIAFIPVGLIGGCGLAMLIRNDTARAVFGMLGLLADFRGQFQELIGDVESHDPIRL